MQKFFAFSLKNAESVLIYFDKLQKLFRISWQDKKTVHIFYKMRSVSIFLKKIRKKNYFFDKMLKTIKYLFFFV